MVPNLEAHLMEGVNDDMVAIADLVSCALFWGIFLYLMLLNIQKGVSSAQSDDTKSLKGPILDWIVPAGQNLNPPLARNVKINCGFHHECTSAFLCPAGLNWSDPE